MSKTIKNCGECKHVKINEIINIKTASCAINDMIVPQYTETGKDIEFHRVPDNCPLKLPIYLDLETTGLDPIWDDVLEIAIIDHEEKVLLDTLVKPCFTTEWPDAQAINHISPAMVQNAPMLKDISVQIKEIVQGRDVHIWNANFDTEFLECLLNRVKTINCAMTEYGQFIERTQPQNKSQSGRYKLINTAQDLGVTVEGDAHRAKHDVLKMIRIRKAYQKPGFNRTDLNGSVNVEPYK